MNSRIPCVQSWTGPSPNNNFDTCHWDKWVNNNIADPVVPASIVTVVMVVVLIAFPAIVLMRYLCCSCGSCTQRPDADCCTCLRRRRRPFGGLFYTTLQRNSGIYGEQTTLVQPVVDGEMPVYSRKSVRRAKRAAYRAALIGIVATIFACIGMGLVVRALQNGTVGVDDMLNNILAAKLTDLKTTTSTGTQTYYEPLTAESFSPAEDAINNANSILREFKRLMFNGNSNDWNQGKSGRAAAWVFATAGVCLIPMAVLAMGACSACCNIRRVVPLCTSLFMFMLFLFAGVSAITMIGVHFSTEVVTNEVNAQSLRSASILQWYTVPQCQAHPLFQSLGSQVKQAFERKAFSACSNAVVTVNGGSLCDSSAWYNSELPNTVFVCQPTAAVQCNTPSAAELFVQRGLKSGAPEGICGPISNADCTVTQCSEFCTDATIRSLAAAVVRDTTISININNAYTNDVLYVQDCNTLLDTLIREVGGRKAVKLVSDALVMGTVSSVLFMVALVVGMIAMLRGQKRFIRDNETFTESGYVPVQTAVQPFVTSSKSPMGASPQMMYGVPVQHQQATNDMTPALLEAIVQDDTCCRGNNYGSC